MPFSKTYIRIICEGAETEPNYFNGWIRSLGIKAVDVAFKPKDHSPLGVARAAKAEHSKAVKLKIPPAKIFIFAVFDRDGHPFVPEALSMLEGTPIKALFSNICFEYWILLHFEQTSRSFSNCDEIISYIRRHHDPDYAKNKDHFQRLKTRISTAYSNALWLKTQQQFDERRIWERNPSTNVHEIFDADCFKKLPA